MGQYYYIVNLDKRQFLHPHKFGDGLKLLEFGSSGSGTMCGLAVLLADGNGRGGGDLTSNEYPYDPVEQPAEHQRVEHEWESPAHGDYPAVNMQIRVPNLVGSWAGDRIVIAGDYADPDNFMPTHIPRPEGVNLYQFAGDNYDDISWDVIRAMCDDQYLRQEIIERYWNPDNAPEFIRAEVSAACKKRQSEMAAEYAKKQKAEERAAKKAAKEQLIPV